MHSTALFPVFLDLADRHCLVVGGGAVARRKSTALLEAGARVTVVAPVIDSEFLKSSHPQLSFEKTLFHPSQVQGKWLVIAATSKPEINHAVHQACEQAGVWVNVVDDPDYCSYQTPAVVNRGVVQVAISTAGHAPVLARQLRAAIETLLPSQLGRLAEWMGQLRAQVKQKLGDTRRIRRFWEARLRGPLAAELLKGETPDKARWLADDVSDKETEGEVSLVGAGPGDAELLTLKAFRCLQDADVVLYDALVGPGVLSQIRKDAERIFVGKRSGHHSVKQADIVRMMVDYARQGLRVVRLKGGDPLLFGRLGEELDGLMDAGVSAQVVPGITAASACAASLGIPLTDRDLAHGVSYVSGHLSEQHDDTDWRYLVGSEQTLVIYMGLSNIEHISQRLMAHGMDPSTPAAVIEAATLSDERAVISNVAELPNTIRASDIKAPALIIIGKVVRRTTQEQQRSHIQSGMWPLNVTAKTRNIA